MNFQMNHSPAIIDVRERDEFEAEHVEGSICLPLSTLQLQAPGILRNLQGREIQVLCRSGRRAGLAIQQLNAMGLGGAHLKVFEGGIIEWKSQGRPVTCAKKAHLPLMRQVQLSAGSLVVLFTALAWFVNPYFALGSAFVGAGLMTAGLTGFCGMAEILAKMPWNKGPNAPTSTVCGEMN